VDQLAGKAVGVTTPSGTDALAVRALARKRGVDPSTITMIAVGPTNLLQSLEGGAVAAANLSVPLNTMARDHGYNWLAFIADEVEGTFTGFAASERKLKEQPEQVKRLLRATLKGLDFLQSRRAEVEAYMVRDWDLPERLAAPTYDVFMRTINMRALPAPSAIEADAAFAAEELGIERSSIQTSALVDFRLLEEVLRETGRR
jgi:ABC-type nitrate/sulfonate/bicarbonate transport system substrate-binding protein